MASRGEDDLATAVDDAVLAAFAEKQPSLVATLRALVAQKQNNKQILIRCCDANATPTLMRHIAHCLDAIRRESKADRNTKSNE